MNGNITTAPLGGNRNIKTKPMYQYDYGQVLKIIGVTLPAAYEVHFSNQLHGVATTQIGNADGVIIPDIYLTTGEPVYAWIYLHTGNSDGETEYTITIPVVRRASISDAEPTPVQQDVITQAIAALNTAVEQTAQDVQDATEAKQDAEEAAGNAYESAVAAAQSATNANTSAGQAQSAQAASELAQQKAEEAQTGAQTAKWAAESAQTAAEAAQAGAVAARTGAETAQTGAVAARSGAETAQHAAEAARDEITGLSATANTLPAGSQATASYADGLLTLGIPQGAKGDTGDTGATPDLTIGTVQTLPAGSSATASITGTAEDPVLNLGIPKGDQGEVSQAEFDALSDTVDDMQDTLEHKADIDGYYTDMTVGAAEQVVSSTMVEDNAPYKLRTSGGSTDIGNRAYVDKIVGGTVAWNQLAVNGDFSEGTTEWNATNGTNPTVVNNVYTFTPVGQYNNMTQNLSNRNPGCLKYNYKYLLMAEIKTETANNNIQIGVGDNVYFTYAKSVSTGTTFSEFSYVINIASQNTSNIREAIFVRTNDTSNFTPISVKNVQFFNLTQMFGSTIADYIYSLETANAGAGMAWFRKLFPEPYYAYNAGELLSVEGLQSRDVVGFNQWDEEWEVGSLSSGIPVSSNNQIRSKNFCKCLGNTSYYLRTSKTDGGNQNIYYVALNWYDSDKNFISFVYSNNRAVTSPENAAYFKINTNSSTVVYGNTYNHDICINLSHNASRNGSYEPYTHRSYPLDSTLTLRGIPKVGASGVYWDGDEYGYDGAVKRRYGVVDLGTLNYSTNWGQGCYDVSGVISNANAIISKYSFAPNVNSQTIPDKTWTFASARLFIKDSDYSSPAAFKAAMSGVYLIYELATPTTETAQPYQHIQSVDDWGTEEFVSTSIVPVGHQSRYPQNLRDKLQHLPALASANGSYIITQTNGQMVLSPFPAPPTAAGNYLLKATVSGGNATYSWVAQ